MGGYDNDALREERCIQSVNIPQQYEKLLVEQYEIQNMQKKIFDNLRDRPFFQANLLQQFNDAEHMNGSHYNPYVPRAPRRRKWLRRQSGRSGWIDEHGMSWGFVPCFELD